MSIVEVGEPTHITDTFLPGDPHMRVQTGARAGLSVACPAIARTAALYGSSLRVCIACVPACRLSNLFTNLSRAALGAQRGSGGCYGPDLTHLG